MKTPYIAAAILASALSICRANDTALLASVAAPRHEASPAQRWQQMREQVAALPEAQRVWHVNALFNNYAYRSDIELHGVEDRWDAPLEFVARGAGDCEDFAIAKYFMLLDSGLAEDRLQLAFAFHDDQADSALGRVTHTVKRTHVVLLYRGHNDGEPRVLDVIDTMLPLSERSDLKLVFEFDARGTYALHSRAVSVGAVRSMLLNWVGVLRRGALIAHAQSLRVVARAPAFQPVQPGSSVVLTALR